MKVTKEHRLKVKKRLIDDFVYYARNCLKVQPKGGGGLVSFVLNESQLYVHGLIEKQLKKKGMYGRSFSRPGSGAAVHTSRAGIIGKLLTARANRFSS